jgi:hypothetical protein
MHKNATECNKTLNKWCKNKHGASKIMDTLETYQGSIGLGGVEEEVALEEEGEVPEVSRRLYLRGAAGVDASNLSAGIEALAWRFAAKRRAIMTV